MSLKFKAIIFSLLAIVVLVVSFVIFQEYKSINARLYHVTSTLDMVNHAGHEIAIEVLLDFTNTGTLNEHLEQIPLITRRLKGMLQSKSKPAELVAMEMSFVRFKRIVDNLTSVESVPMPILEQIRNEVAKIGDNVARLKKISEDEIHALQRKSEIMIAILYSILVAYIFCMFVLLFNIIINPILQISRQIELVGRDELDKVVIAPRKDEIGQLAESFNRMNAVRKQTEQAFSEEIKQHVQTLEEVKVLSGFLPICASCKNIRDDQGYWNKIEQYISDHTEAVFSHGLCPDCARELYPEYVNKQY